MGFGFFFALNMALAQFHERIENDGAKSGSADAAEREASDMDREVAGTQNQRDGSDNQIAVVAEVHMVDYPNTGASDGNETEDDDGGAPENRLRNRLNDCAEFG